MKLKPIFDPGHGGIVGGVYQTPGKRSPDLGKGVLFEGAFNRWIVNRLQEKLDRLSIPYYNVCPELEDVKLETRTLRANNIYASDKNTYLLSIHANAGGGVGIEGYTTIGKTPSDSLGEKFLWNLRLKLKDRKFRLDMSDGDLDKESDFWVLRKSNCPAVLLELGFMDNQIDYDYLFSEEGIDNMVDALLETIIGLYNEK